MIIDYKKLEEYLYKLTGTDYLPVYLIYGENQLFKWALKKLIKKIIPHDSKELSCEYINCSELFDIFEIVSKLSTYSMFTPKKIIVLKETNFFNSAKNNITQGFDIGQILSDSIIKGFCKDNHLIITAEVIDKRKKLFKIINDIGVIIDCFISKGTTKDEKKIQSETLAYITDNILSKEGKKLTKEAYEILCDLTGFDLSTFSDHLKKLISFVGEKTEITLADVKALVNRTKEDPIYQLTDAISTRDTKNALFYIDSLLNFGFHPLAILSAIINQVRKLLVVKSFIEENETYWKVEFNFNQFKKNVMPAIIDYDEKINKFFLKANTDKEDKKSSLLITKNKNKIFPIYQTFIKSNNFTLKELINAFEYLEKIDNNLKSTALDSKIMLQKIIISLF